jgi:hypothetical protein
VKITGRQDYAAREVTIIRDSPRSEAPRRDRFGLDRENTAYRRKFAVSIPTALARYLNFPSSIFHYPLLINYYPFSIILARRP